MPFHVLFDLDFVRSKFDNINDDKWNYTIHYVKSLCTVENLFNLF